MAKTMKSTSLKTSNPMRVSFQLNPVKGRKFTTSEIGRGIGVHKTDKGKGSYSRKGRNAQKERADWS
ncbi:hypothetical protein CVD28_03170 [Bacillus sp. M6-12]|uniref:hypothetical protein n=1 Tax=Bacillus sp. M6-12 TaxID=2054166 RepID=UPI000C761F96|nr:hypothetical protein [Bacillus sp. M6-12]PLS19431.1 hypothetical protein CVD28_03170 [Bacillus sp. M6-12]